MNSLFMVVTCLTTEVYTTNQIHKNWKNWGKPGWYGMWSGLGKWENEKNATLPYKATTYCAIPGQTTAKQE